MKIFNYLIFAFTAFFFLSGCTPATPEPIEVTTVHKAEAKEKQYLYLRVKTHERDASDKGNLAIALFNIATYAKANAYTHFSFENKPVSNRLGMPLTNTKDLMRYCWPQDIEEGDDFYEHKCQKKSKKNNNYLKVFKNGYTKGYRHTFSYKARLYTHEQYLFPTWSVEEVLNDKFLKQELTKAKEETGVSGKTEIILHDDNT